MRRRLETAFDTMTMPDSCVQRIEQQLTIRLAAKKDGNYVQTVTVKRRSPLFPVLAAAACMVLVMTAAFHLPGNREEKILDMELTGPEQVATNQQTLPTEAAVTPEGYYQLVTDLSVAQVEQYAEDVKEEILSENWSALSTRLHYPIKIEEEEITNWKEFTDLTAAHKINPEFVAGIQREDCRELFCNWQGISMGDFGQVWFNQVTEEDGWTGLKITALNGLLLPDYNFDYEVLEDGSVAMTRYTGEASAFTVPSSIGGRHITVLGANGFAGCDFLEAVHICDGLVSVEDNAFSQCGSLREVHIAKTVEKIGHAAFSDCPNLTAVYFYGDAPAAGNYVFDLSPDATVYYLEGTLGWEDTWEGRPTKTFGVNYRNHPDLQLFYELYYPTVAGVIGRDLTEFQTEVQRLGYSFYILDNVFDIFPDNNPDSSVSIHGVLTGQEGNQKIETLQYFHIGKDYQDRVVSCGLDAEIVEYALRPVGDMEGILTTSITEMEEYVWSALK